MSWFSPKNASKLQLTLNILMCCNILAMEGGFIAWLAAVEADAPGDSVIQRALNRTRGTTSIYTRVLTLTGVITYIILAVVMLWFYSGKNRLAWAMGGLGMLMRTGSRVLWRFRFESAKTSPVTATIFVSVSSGLSTICFFYWIFTPKDFMPRKFRVWLGLGILIINPALVVAFIFDDAVIAPLVVEVVGLVICFTSFASGMYVQHKEEKSLTETEPLIPDDT